MARNLFNELVVKALSDNGFDGVKNENNNCECDLRSSHNDLLSCKKLGVNCTPCYGHDDCNLYFWKEIIDNNWYPKENK